MQTQKKFDKNIISTLLLIFILGICFLFTSLLVNRIATDSCYKTLEDATAQVAVEIKGQVDSDREQLEVVAGILSEYDSLSSREAQNLICSFQQRGMISTLGLLLPGNGIVLCNDDFFEMGSILHYKSELEKIPYLSGVHVIRNTSNKFLYQAVPIERNNKVRGILYGFVNLSDFSDLFSVKAFGNSSELYLIDGSNGDFLIDTWHDSLGNMYAEDPSARTAIKGSSYETFYENFSSGNEGNLAFHSEAANDSYYSYYMPVGINQWMVMLTVPESVAFADAIQIRYILYLLTTAEIVSFLIYFLWVLTRVHKQTYQKECQLAQTLYMLDVQQTLFDAHKNPDLIISALEKAANMLTAEYTFLAQLDGTLVKELFTWPAAANIIPSSFYGKDLKQTLPNISSMLLAGESVYLSPKHNKHDMGKKDRSALKHNRISSLMLTPVLNSADHLTGVLGGINMKREWTDASLLECIARNFLMALNNVNSYRLIQEMGIMDSLTGLKNRNCYQHALMEYSCMKNSSLCCIYMDANGLHELNNHLGHAAGDEMLKAVGKSLKAIFGGSDAYRIGGDEFVVFCQNCSEADVSAKVSLFRQQMLDLDYHISIGTAWQDTAPHIDLLIAEAERRMYEAKHLYYQEKGDVSKAREMNHKLEQILLEKKDADTFLSIISSYFMGVYVINLNTDDTRAIYKPSYFANVLEQTHYKFRAALDVYTGTYVVAEDRDSFISFTDYDAINAALDTEEKPEFHYRKTDGTQLILRIYKSADYSPARRETFWLFEEYKK